MACTLITPQLKLIAKNLKISPVRASVLASLTRKEDWTEDDISRELLKQSKVPLSEFMITPGTIFSSLQSNTLTLVYSDKQGNIHVDLPNLDPGTTVLNFLQGADDREHSDKSLFQAVLTEIPQDKWDLLSTLLHSNDPLKSARAFMAYYAMHRIAYNLNFNDRPIEELKEIIKHSIIDSIDLFHKYNEAVNGKKIIPTVKAPVIKLETTITYTPEGKTLQTYKIEKSEDGNYHIINKDGKEVFKEDSKDRRKIFANLAVAQKRAVVVTYKNKQYVVNNRDEIISVTTGDKMLWGEENGDRKAILLLAKELFEELKKTTPTKPLNITKLSGYWSRQQAQATPNILYVFTDNTDRNSGSGVIPSNSWYSKKYGAGRHYPSQTSAVVRGLENARPISTLRWYHKGAIGDAGRWTDADAEEFEKVINAELQDIIEAWNTGLYSEIRFPDGDGLFNANISAISKLRVPKLYNILSTKLKLYGFELLVPKETLQLPVLLTLQQIQQGEEFQREGTTVFSSYKPNQLAQQLQQSQELNEEFLAAEGATVFSSYKPHPIQGTQQIQVVNGTTIQQSITQTQQPQTQSKPINFMMPQADRNYLVISGREENPLTKFNRDFTSLQKQEAVEALATDFSDTVTQLINQTIQENRQRGINPEFEERYLSPSEEDRREFIKANGQRIFDEMLKHYNDYLSDEKFRQMDLRRFGADFVTKKLEWLSKITIPTNYEILLKDVSMILERTENIALGVDRTIKDTQEVESTTEEDKEDSEKFDKDGWMIKIREVDPRLTLSSRVKKALATIPKGKEINIFGKKKFLSPDFVHAVLIDELSNMAYVEDFVKDVDGKRVYDALDRLSAKYIWVKNIIRRLESDRTLESQFFTDFRKDFIKYISVIDVYEYDEETGERKRNDRGEFITKRVTKDLNKAVALESTMSELISNYDSGNKLTDNSIYDIDGINESNRTKVSANLGDITSTINDYDFDWKNKEDRKKVFEDLVEVLKSVGLNVQFNDLEALVSDPQFSQEINTIIDKLSTILTGSVPKDSHLIDYFNNAYTSIAEIVCKVSETMNIQSFKAGDKMFYSYSAPNYINTIIKRLKDIDPARRAEYIEKEFKQYEWFYDHENNRWRNGLIEMLVNNEDVRNHLEIENMNVITRINRDGSTETIAYNEWTKDDMEEAFLMQYYSIPINPSSNIQYAKYIMPIYSDSPLVNLVTLPRFTGENYKEQLLDRFVDIINQELLRIKDIAERRQLVEEGKLSKTDLIANYDSQGAKFLFFPELNDIPNFYKDVNALLGEGKIDEANKMIRDAIRDIMNTGAAEYIRQNRVSPNLLIKTGAINTAEEMNNALEEYYWNQCYASSQMIQLATTDLAFYKNGVDFQKRFKEVYAAGNKLNTHSKYGKTKERVLYLKDEKLKSNVFPQLEDVLTQAVDEGRITALDKKAILSKFEKVNVADAQAYRSIYSMRSVLDMMGQWTPKMEKAVNKFEEGNWTIEDFSTIWQTIKPFMFTQTTDISGNGKKRKVPNQNKNSEFLLLAMHSLFAQSALGKSPVLKALNKFMIDNDIDVVMFESAVKAGGQTVVKVTDGMNEDAITKTLREAAKKPTTIKEFDYEDYVIQQPTPEHLIDCIGKYGSQFRNLIVSDISEYMEDGKTLRLFDVRVDTNKEGKPVYKQYNKQELLKLYQGAIVENLLEDYQKVKGKFADIYSLQKALLESLAGSNNNSPDVIEALQIVDGRFNIPLYNPSTTEKIQQVINSFFKSNITVQKIKGGNAILVSDFGFVDDLHCLYDVDSNGKKRLVGVECYMPAYSKSFYDAYAKTDENGNSYIDIKEIEKECPELLEAIGYRIPTENKYSMVPLIIKGFLPQANGSAIMLPADITIHAGSDFDVK